MKLDKKKVNALLLTYIVPTVAAASTAFALDASSKIQLLTFLSGVLAIVIRQVNPRDNFTCNVLHEAQIEVDKLLKAELNKEKN